nr:unnamed protein product [Digitaria exilis]
MARQAAMLPASMILVQAIMVGMLLLSKLSLSAGMSPIVLTVYRNIVAAVAVAPFGLVFERELLKKVNWVVLAWITGNATFGPSPTPGAHGLGPHRSLAAASPARSSGKALARPCRQLCKPLPPPPPTAAR